MEDPSGWARIAPYLDRALDLEVHERERWLAELTTQQPAIAESLRRLLEEHEALQEQGFLAGSAIEGMDETALKNWLKRRAPRETGDILGAFSRHDGHAAGPSSLVGAGTIVGSYRLVREIGQGGMSSVWLAERCDGQLQREVALKLPFEGPRRAQLAERFKRERDILATLTHPNIARLYDAGVSSTGQPYLVMEYVHGAGLTRYCDTGRLSVRERLKIFLQVLAAVEFAHTQLVLHRDLKPSNMLVTAQGRVVLLDFGIAKLLSQDPGPASPLTEMAGPILTPDYASPEHISGGALGTASDVYSLGVVLCELLTGSRPFGSQHESRRALEDAILKRDPTRPSQLPLPDDVAAARSTTPRRLAQTLDGDLDTIVLKALKKVPAERYRSVVTLSQDISNYLGSLPVSARPDSFRYRFRRFVSRYKLQMAAASVASLAIVAGAGVAMWQAREAAQERDRALALASRNGAIEEFMATLISEAAESERPVTVSEMLARSEQLALADTGDNRDDRAAVLGTIAERYYTSGDAGKSAALLQRALALVRDSRDSGLRSQLICAHALAIANLGEVDAGIRAITAELDRSNSDPDIATDCLLYRSFIAAKAGDADSALHYATLGLERYHRSLRPSLAAEGLLLGAVANGYHMKGDNGHANHYFELAMQKYTGAGRDRSPGAITVRNNWANVSLGAGAPRRALELYDQTLSIVAERDPGGHPPAYLFHNRARALEAIGRYPEARTAYELGTEAAVRSKSTLLHAYCLLGLAAVALDSHDLPGAEQFLNQNTGLLAAAGVADSPPAITQALVQGRLDLVAGRLDPAGVQFERVLGKKPSGPQRADAELGRAEVELRGGDVRAAEVDSRAALELASSLQGGERYSNRTGLAWLMLGRALQAAGKPAQARDALDAAVSHLSNTVDADQPDLAHARELRDELK